MSIDPRLLDKALKTLRKADKGLRKKAFVPAGAGGGDSVSPELMAALGGGGGDMPPELLAALAGGVGAPADTSAAGGGAGAPADIPPDLLAALAAGIGGAGGGGPPPPEPAAGGGGAAPPVSPDMIRSIIREEIANVQSAGKPAKSKKAGPDQLYEELVRIRKLLLHLYNILGIGLPTSILDTEDDADEEETQEGHAPQAESAIQPIETIPPAFPVPKTASFVIRRTRPELGLTTLAQIFDWL